MQITLSTDTQQTAKVAEFFDFNDIAYQQHAFFDPDLDHGRFIMPRDHRGCLAVLDHESFSQILEWPQGMASLVEYVRHNRVWVFGTHDVVLMLLRRSVRANVQNLDGMIASHSITLFLEATPSDRCYLSGLRNIGVQIYPNWHFHAPRIRHGSVTKHTPTKDFMLTMTRKHGALHRQCLWQQLERRPELMSRGHVAYHQTRQHQWIGEQPRQHSWRSGYPSMDLYLDSWLEIVPETLFKDAYFFTEKTCKPLATKTPFLCISNRGYLQYLRNMGFRTFGSLIDESYDEESRVQDRAKRLVDTLDDIVQTGTADFYHASQDILEHNYQRLCELGGDWLNNLDTILAKHLAIHRKKTAQA